MLLPALAFVLIAAAVGVGAALIPHEARPIGQFAIVVLGVVLAVWLVLLPFPALADHHVHDHQSSIDHSQRHPQQGRQGPAAEPDQ